MKIEKFKELEKKINGQNFNQSYKTINIVLTVLSYFGHIASIFLAYFMLSKVIEGAMTGNIVVAGIASVILLGGLELLKRDMFDKFSISFLKFVMRDNFSIAIFCQFRNIWTSASSFKVGTTLS